MATVNLYETTITGTTGDNDVALSSEIDFIDDDETDSCLFVVRSDYSVAIGDELNYYDYRNINIFSGIVRDIKNNNPKEVLVFKYDMLLADRTVNDVFEGYTIEGLIQYIVETYSSLTFSSTFVSGITIEKYVSKNKNALSVVKDLIAQVPNLTYDVSNSKVFTLFVKSSVNSGITLENGVNCRILNGWTQNTSKQVTRLTLIGAKQVQQGKTETFSGDGSTATFTISEIPSSIQVIVGGVEQELSVDGQRDGNYTVSPETKKVTFLSGSIPASGTNNITITYTFEIDITIEFDADDSIIQKYGIIERTITKKYINKMDDAFDYSSQHIEKFAEPLLNARVQRLNSIDITNLTPGYNIFIKDEINKVDGANVSGFFTIKSVKRLFPEGSLIIEVGELGVDGIEIIKEANYNIKQLYESDNNSSIIQKSQTLKNKVKIKCKSELELQLYRDLPDDYMYLGDENDTPVYANISDGIERPLRDETITNDGAVSGGLTIADDAITGNKTDAYVQINHSSSFSTLNANQTWYFWSKRNTFNSVNTGLMTKRSSGAFIVLTEGSSIQQFKMRLNDGSNNRETTFTVVPDLTEWHLVTMVVDGFNSTGAKFYLNGVLVNTLDISTITSLINTNNIRLLRDGFSTSTFSDSQIDNVLIYEGSHTQEQIEEVYTAGRSSYTPIREGLIGQWTGKDFEGTEATPTKILDVNYKIKDEIFYITDKDYWANPDYEIAQTGSLQSWKNI